MRPVEAVRELTQETSSGNGAAISSTNIRDIRKVTLELGGVLIGKRQLPATIIGCNAGCDKGYTS